MTHSPEGEKVKSGILPGRGDPGAINFKEVVMTYGEENFH